MFPIYLYVQLVNTVFAEIKKENYNKPKRIKSDLLRKEMFFSKN